MKRDDSIKPFLAAVDEALARVSAGDAAEGAPRAGLIRSVRDGIIDIQGLPGLRIGEVVRVPWTGAEALVLQVERDGALAVLMHAGNTVTEGMAAEATGDILAINAHASILGRVVDPLGRPLDRDEAIKEGKAMQLERVAPGVMTRQSVSVPMQTGILAVDALIPVGRGQRELIIGDRQTGKTTIALDTILNQKDQDVICVYVAIGQREAKVANVVETLRAGGALPYTVVVSAGASAPAMLQFLAPYAGAAIGEYFMEQGKDVLIIYDDLTKHAVAYREASLLLRRPPGREAYPGDVFYIHSRLLERAARLNKDNGGGSMTALPIIETQAGDVSAYIPTNVISITDGQIFLESSLFYRGIRPAINVGISVSRVGGAAQTKVMKKVAGSAKLDLAQYDELAAFSQFSSELDASTKKQLARGERMVEAFKQKAGRPYRLWQEVVVLWAATKGHLDAVAKEDVQAKLEALMADVEARRSDLVAAIEKEQALTDDIAAQLEEAAVSFFAATA